MFAQNAKRLLKLGIQGAGFLVLVLVLLTSSLHPQRERREETVDYYERWLERDVVYIVSEEERQVFQKLTTPEEKDSFIEQFWLRRGPNPTFAENEFKAEHCRRLAYANERFSSGIEGWATDRGRIYIRFGPPRSIDRNPTGEYHMRSPGEGGGETFNYPYEVWYYDYMEGIGAGISLEYCGHSVLIQGPVPMFYLGFTERSAVRNYRESLSCDSEKLARFVLGMLQRGIRLIGRGLWYVTTAHTDSDVAETLHAAEETFREL